MSKLITPDFRVAYPNVFQPRRNDLSQKDEYSVVALFPKGTDLTPLKLAAQNAIIEKFGSDKTKWPKHLKSPFRDQGDRIEANERKNKTAPGGFEAGAIYLNLKSNNKPGLVDQQVQQIIDSSEFYGGCWARASVVAFAYEQKGNVGVSFGLGNIQKVKDDTPFGNRTAPQDDFVPVEALNQDESLSADDIMF